MSSFIFEACLYQNEPMLTLWVKRYFKCKMVFKCNRNSARCQLLFHPLWQHAGAGSFFHCLDSNVKLLSNWLMMIDITMSIVISSCAAQISVKIPEIPILFFSEIFAKFSLPFSTSLLFLFCSLVNNLKALVQS